MRRGGLQLLRDRILRQRQRRSSKGLEVQGNVAQLENREAKNL